ncbi:MAG: zinc ribbon domain-containing protein [Nitrospirae bacterium]|nr:zinc ribbon domain-containing protein [Nitrospirota bacterium]MBI5695099.1 zinc ribbon domain-containing protein [Nitrospirota bacterium]
MPMYEYRCGGCNETFTVMQKMGAGAEGLSCPACRSTELSKLISSTFSPESEKAMPTDLEMSKAMHDIQKASAGSPCASGMCGGGGGNTCSIKEFG